MRALTAALLVACSAVFCFTSYIDASSLPPEALRTIALIKSGVHFPYSSDGVVLERVGDHA